MTYDSISSTISCKFLRLTDTSEKLCNISYKFCQQDTRAENNIMNSSTSTFITISLSLSPGIYCFQAKVSNDTFNVTVEGIWSISESIVIIIMQW